MKKVIPFTFILMGALPMAVAAQQSTQTQFGPSAGDREFSLSGTGSSDRNFDSGSFGLVGDLGWYRQDNMVWGFRQSIFYADIQGESFSDDFWNASTRGYMNYGFGEGKMKPFIGGSLGFVYGDGIDNSAFAGLELGSKYYVLEETFILSRVEYQWFFDDDSNADVAFKSGAWAFTLGVGYNF